MRDSDGEQISSTRARAVVDLSEAQTILASARSHLERARELSAEQNRNTAARHRQRSSYHWLAVESTAGGEEHYIVDYDEDCLCIWKP